MVRRSKVEMSLVLYISAIVVFVVVSKERDKLDERLALQNETIIKMFFPPVPIRLESDTLRWYVDADESGNIPDAGGKFFTRVTIGDIGPEDDVDLKLHAIIKDTLLISTDVVRIGDRKALGGIEARRVYFPVSASFSHTGRYVLDFVVRARRVHHHKDMGPVYRGIRIDTNLIPSRLLDELESATATLIVVVEDTSISNAAYLESLELSLEKVSISSAVGYQARNTIISNLGWSRPDVSIVRGGGTLEPIARTDRSAEYLWTGEVSDVRDSVVIEARLHREAGGRDVARASFTVSGAVPFVTGPIHSVLFAGEALDVNIKVEGLASDELYDWQLYEVVAGGEAMSKLNGEGPLIHYRIPSSFAGKTLRIAATYAGRPYRFVDRDSYIGGVSTFEFPVVDPPVHIGVSLADAVSASGSFIFTASRFSDPAYAGEQPVASSDDVEVTITRGNGDILLPIVTMMNKGRFRFSLASPDQISEGGEHVLVRIAAGETIFEKRVSMLRD